MTTPTIDPATFEALKASTGTEFAMELVGTFLEEAPGMLNDLRSALAANDAATFKRAAHTLKSNGNTFGALTFAAHARALELAGVGSVKEGGAKPMDELDAEYARVAAALSAMRYA